MDWSTLARRLCAMVGVYVNKQQQAFLLAHRIKLCPAAIVSLAAPARRLLRYDEWNDRRALRCIDLHASSDATFLQGTSHEQQRSTALALAKLILERAGHPCVATDHFLTIALNTRIKTQRYSLNQELLQSSGAVTKTAALLLPAAPVAAASVAAGPSTWHASLAVDRAVNGPAPAPHASCTATGGSTSPSGATHAVATSVLSLLRAVAVLPVDFSGAAMAATAVAAPSLAAAAGALDAVSQNAEQSGASPDPFPAEHLEAGATLGSMAATGSTTVRTARAKGTKRKALMMLGSNTEQMPRDPSRQYRQAPLVVLRPNSGALRMAALLPRARRPLFMFQRRPPSQSAVSLTSGTRRPRGESSYASRNAPVASDTSEAGTSRSPGNAPRHMHQARPGLAPDTYHVSDVLKGLRALPDCSVDCVITSSPYNKRGLHRTVTGLQTITKASYPGTWHKRIHYDKCSDDMDEDKYQEQQIEVLNELHRVLKEDGTVWLNHKARRAGFKEHMPTDFIQRSKLNLYGHVVWNLKRSVNQHVGFFTPVHEYLYQLTKSASPPAFFKKRLPMEFRSSVWTIKPERVKGHPCVRYTSVQQSAATLESIRSSRASAGWVGWPFPLQLAENCILASTANRNAVVLDCYAGSGTTLLAAKKLGRQYIGIDASAKYKRIFERRSNEMFGEQQQAPQRSSGPPAATTRSHATPANPSKRRKLRS